MAQLLELRAALEKLRPLDTKLRFQIDRLLRAAEMSREARLQSRDPLSFRPNPDALVGKAAGDEGDEEEGGRRLGVVACTAPRAWRRCRTRRRA